MKKLGVLFIILFLSMSLASAGFWGYGFGFLITGNVVAEENVQQQYEERKQEFYQGNQPQVGSGDYNQQLYGEDWCANGMCCPDGICDDFEKSTTGCPIDS